MSAVGPPDHDHDEVLVCPYRSFNYSEILNLPISFDGFFIFMNNRDNIRFYNNSDKRRWNRTCDGNL